MRNLRFLLLGLLTLVGTGTPTVSALPTWSDPTPGVIDGILIDMNPAGNSPVGLVPLLDPCGSVGVGGTTDIDIVVDEVDPSDLISEFQVELDFEDSGFAGTVEVVAVDTAGQMISANPGSSHVSGSGPVPDDTSPFVIGATDTGAGPGAHESGEGVLARITFRGKVAGVSTVELDAANTFVLDQNGAPIPVNKFGASLLGVGVPTCAGVDLAIVEETITGPPQIGLGGGFTLQKTIRNKGPIPDLDVEITTDITPPMGCDAGSGPGNQHTIVTLEPAVPILVDVPVDIPLSLTCSPGSYDADIQIRNEIDPADPFIGPEFTLREDNVVSHEVLPGLPPPLAATPIVSPVPALRVSVLTCPVAPPWPAPPGDGDCDAFTDAEEAFTATDAADPCPDDPDDDAWPADMASGLPAPDNGFGKHDGISNILDIVQLTPPVFGAFPPDPNYTPRKDFNGDNIINILDIVRLTPPIFGATCT